jgi:hypothetical protein
VIPDVYARTAMPQRRRLAVKGEAVGRAGLRQFVGRSTVQRVLADHGIEPVPERGKHTRWSTFLRAHWGAIAATDFFSVEVLTLSGLVRHFVPFVIDLKSRRVEIAGIVHQPSSPSCRTTSCRSGRLSFGCS